MWRHHQTTTMGGIAERRQRKFVEGDAHPAPSSDSRAPCRKKVERGDIREGEQKIYERTGEA